MGRTATLADRELAWAKAQFGEYYRSRPVEPPARFARREFAAFPFTATASMRRHTALRTAEEFSTFLRRDPPRHAYYSSAYYRFPDAPNMNAKEWLGADLIFDLDADHLRLASGMTYPEQLRLVRDRLCVLVDDFLVGDFGLDPDSTHIVFSGGRGYHVHVQSPAYLSLTSPERREIVDYVLGLGFDPTKALRTLPEAEPGPSTLAAGSDEEYSGPRLRGRAPPAFRQLYPPDAPGWKGRLTRALLRLLARWDAEGVPRAVEDLVGFGVSRPKARALARTLVTEGYGRRIQEGLSLDVFRREVPRELLDTVLRFAAIELQGETDAPVTTDIHRLIRLPGSLHGGTGFRVTPLSREAVNHFDPFRDALAFNGPGSPVAVHVLEALDYPFQPEAARGDPGTVRELPRAAALFAILRGEAALPTESGS